MDKILNNVNTLVFDFDGVLENTFALNFKLSKMKFPNLTKEEYIRWHDGNVIKNVSEVKVINEEFDYDYEKTKELLKFEMDIEIKNIIKKLGNKFDLFIITSASEILLEKYLKKNSVNSFKKILGKETHGSKIKKFNMLFKEENKKPHEILFITDTLGDILEANEVKVLSIGTTWWTFQSKEKLKIGNPLRIFEKKSELLKLLN